MSAVLIILAVIIIGGFFSYRLGLEFGRGWHRAKEEFVRRLSDQPEDQDRGDL